MAVPIIWRLFPKAHRWLLDAIAKNEAAIARIETPEHVAWRYREGDRTPPIVLTKLARLVPLWPEGPR